MLNSKFTTALTCCITLVLLASCYSAPTVKNDATLNSNETNTGYLLVTAKREWTEAKRDDLPLLQLLYKGGDLSALEMGSIPFIKDEDLILQKLQAGEYYIYNSHFGFKHMNLPKMTFHIKPGEITYIGDFHIRVKWPKFGLLTERELKVSNNSPLAINELRIRYPNISKTYPVNSEVTAISLSD